MIKKDENDKDDDEEEEEGEEEEKEEVIRLFLANLTLPSPKPIDNYE